MIRDELDPKAPALVLFFTDGATGNTAAIEQELIGLSGEPIFWQFVGLGYTPGFLATMDNHPGMVVDSVGLYVPDLTRLADPAFDAEFFEQATREYIGKWLPAARAKGIIR